VAVAGGIRRCFPTTVGLTDDNRALEQKLQAARSNNRFLDKRLADLEAELLESQVP
jgi:hypothetical protein